MIKSPHAIKNKCEGCNKFLLLHNKILSCQLCEMIMHSQCAKKHFRYDNLTDSWQCNNCFSNAVPRYNPFTSISFDKYDPVHIDEFEDIREMEKILDSCSTFDTKKLHDFLRSNCESKKTLAALFNNIDGNASNFDTFVADMSGIMNNFSVIGLAETNVDIKCRDLYNLPGYSAEYNEKMGNKKKGSGVALYIKEQLVYTKIDKLCTCTENLESLFISITNTEKPQVFGVLYRPPNGSSKDAMAELEQLILQLPDKNVTLLGDFNYNLLDPLCSNTFESTLFGHNMIPTISLATHEKPGCAPTLIDNILTNSTENLVGAGVLEHRVSHHFPIFCIIRCSYTLDCDDLPVKPKYDYCESNINKFLEDLNLRLDRAEDYNEQNFDIFAQNVKDCIETTFKVEADAFKKSRRNFHTNPWITPGIVSSVNKKEYYYKQWKKTTSISNFVGNEALYDRYKGYRKTLKYIIKSAKRLYYCKKFEHVDGNMKKTWALINELRGKKKSGIKASFIVDGNLVKSKREISNGFNFFFSSVARKLNAKLNSSMPVKHETSSNLSFRKYLNNSVTNSIFLTPCDTEEVMATIKTFQNDKASDIPVMILKKASSICLLYTSPSPRD